MKDKPPKKKNTQITIPFIASLVVMIGIGAITGWIFTKKIPVIYSLEQPRSSDANKKRVSISDAALEHDEKIKEQKDLLVFLNQTINRAPKINLKQAQNRLSTLTKQSNKKPGNEKGIKLSSVAPLEFTLMEQMISRFALFIEKNGLHVTTMKKSKESGGNLVFREITASGNYPSVIAAINAATSLPGLIVSKLSINQVHDDGELALTLKYSFFNTDHANK